LSVKVDVGDREPHRSMSPADAPQEPQPDPDASAERRRETVDRFVSFWGTMASSWGINRAMAKVHALLYCAGRPLNTDQIMERLDISRGSASMNLRALVDWGLAEKEKVEGSRKDHYRAETDVWRATARIIEERERREVRPVQEQLRTLADHLVPDGQSLADRPTADRALHRRIHAVVDLIEVFEEVSAALLPLVRRRDEELIRRLSALAASLSAVEEAPSDPPSTNS
jgi:DNA-binding transcriptional regulator GbsR (MarR family)